MSQSTKKQRHEQARKKHRHQQQEHARELAKKQPPKWPRLALGIGLVAIVAVVAVASLR